MGVDYSCHEYGHGLEIGTEQPKQTRVFPERRDKSQDFPETPPETPRALRHLLCSFDKLSKGKTIW